MSLYIVNVFVEEGMLGNSAAVYYTNTWPDEKTMQHMATQINLSETAFVVKSGPVYSIRYFSPLAEVLFCGHASMAAAYIISETDRISDISMRTKSGKQLLLSRKDNAVKLNFHSEHFAALSHADSVKISQKITGFTSENVFEGSENDDLMILLTDVDLKKLEVNFEELKKLKFRGLIVTNKSTTPDYDFNVRYFAPALGIKEDPVTGSIYGMLCKYWQTVLNKNSFISLHCSANGGVVRSSINGNDVNISGKIKLGNIVDISLLI